MDKKHNANIAIPLENHGSHKKELYVGRKEIIKKLLSVLKNTEDKDDRGSYLIAGYRGVGKTSLIERVIKEYSLNGKIITVKINLGNGNQLNAFNLFLSISNILHDELTKNIEFEPPKNNFDKIINWGRNFLFCSEVSILN